MWSRLPAGVAVVRSLNRSAALYYNTFPVTDSRLIVDARLTRLAAG